MVSPLAAAVHTTEPPMVAPSAMLEVTTNDGGAVEGAFVTVTELVTAAVRPSEAYALTASVCGPSLSVVVSSVPSGSPLNWYGITCSVHFTVPSTRKSTWLTVAPLGAAVHFTGPVSAAPFATLDVTTKDDGGGGGGGGGG